MKTIPLYAAGLSVVAANVVAQVGPTVRYAFTTADATWTLSTLDGDWCEFLAAEPTILYPSVSGGVARASLSKRAAASGTTLATCYADPIQPAIDTAVLATVPNDNGTYAWGYLDLAGDFIYDSAGLTWTCGSIAVPCSVANQLNAVARVSGQSSEYFWSGGTCPSFYTGTGGTRLFASGFSLMEAREENNVCGYVKAQTSARACLGSTVISWTVRPDVSSEAIPIKIAGTLRIDSNALAGIDTASGTGCILQNSERVARVSTASFRMIIRHANTTWNFPFSVTSRSASSPDAAYSISHDVSFPSPPDPNGVWTYVGGPDDPVEFGPAKLLAIATCGTEGLSRFEHVVLAKQQPNELYVAIPWSITMDPNSSIPISGQWQIEIIASNTVAGVDFSGGAGEDQLDCFGSNAAIYGKPVNNVGDGKLGYEDLRRLYLARVFTGTVPPSNYAECMYLAEADIDGNGVVDEIEVDRFLCTEMADFNNDGFADGFDYDDFVTAYEDGVASADSNFDGFVDGFDYDDFIAAFESGNCDVEARGCLSVGL